MDFEEREKELLIIMHEITAIVKDVSSKMEDLPEDEKAEEISKALDAHTEFQQKLQRFGYLSAIGLDRINIVVSSSNDFGRKLYKDGLAASDNYYDKISERNKLFWELAGRMKSGSSLDLPEHLQNVPDPREAANELIDERLGDIVSNYYGLTPAFVKNTVEIPDQLKKIYAESRWCFVFQNYCASVALCRTIVELAFKIKTGKDLDYRLTRLGTQLDGAARLNVIPEEAAWIARHVIFPANSVLHQGKLMDRESAFKVIDRTVDFLEIVFDQD